MRFLIFLILFLTACNKNPIIDNTNINVEDNVGINIKNDSLEYASNTYLYDLIDINNGTITTNNYLIDTTSLGEKKLLFQYQNSLNETKSYEFKIKIVDTTPPLIYMTNKSVKKGGNIDLKGGIICGDNYDRNLVCNIEGSYDINTIGEYPLKVVAIDSSNNKTEKDFKLFVKEKIESLNNNEVFLLSDLIKTYKNENTTIGIDVSSWQGDIDWVKVKNAGVDNAMIRIGYGHNKDGEIKFDSKFEQNLKNAKEAGVKVGLYFYSYAKNTDEAIKQADWIVETLDGEALDLPIAFDWEIWTTFNSYKINFYDLNNIGNAFINELKKHNYEGMIYGSALFLNRVWNIPNVNYWLAHYTSQTDYDKPYSIWQLSSIGKVDGINGNVDLDIFYKQK